MKKLFYITLISLGLFVSCEEDLIIYDNVNGQAVIAFNAPSSVDLPVTVDGDSSLDLEVGVTTVSTSDRTFNLSIDPASTASSSEYSVSPSVIIPAGDYVGTTTVTGNFDAIPDGVTNTLILNLSDAGNAIVGDKNQVTVNIFRFCPSELAGEFTWVASNFVYKGTPLGDGGLPTGTDAFLDDDGDGVYDIESGFWDFGYYCIWYFGQSPGCGSGASGSLQLKEVCGVVEFIGTDQYGDPWTISNVSTSGADLSFTYLSAFGEQADVVLTRSDGSDWPALSE